MHNLELISAEGARSMIPVDESLTNYLNLKSKYTHLFVVYCMAATAMC